MFKQSRKRMILNVSVFLIFCNVGNIIAAFYNANEYTTAYDQLWEVFYLSLAIGILISVVVLMGAQKAIYVNEKDISLKKYDGSKISINWSDITEAKYNGSLFTMWRIKSAQEIKIGRLDYAKNDRKDINRQIKEYLYKHGIAVT